MRILFDNSVPIPLRRFLAGHAVTASVELKWERLKNGKLLAAAQEAGFHLFVTCDQAMRNEKNLTNRRIAILTLGSNFWPLLKARVKEIAALVNVIEPGQYNFMEFPEGHKRNW